MCIRAAAAACERKKTQLDSYRKATVLKETDALGRTREYSEDERKQFIAVTEKQVAEACAPAPPAKTP